MSEPKHRVDLVIRNADLFTGDREIPRIAWGAVAIDTDRIVAVGRDGDVADAFLAARTIDAGGAIVHPGLIETHLHMPSPAFQGVPIDPYGRDKKQISYAVLKTRSTDETTEALAAASAVALMHRGYTFFCEPGTVFEIEAFVAGLSKCGMRGMVSAPFGWDDVSTFQRHEPGYVTQDVLERAPADTRRVVDDLNSVLSLNQDADALVRGYVCLYGLGTSTDDLTREAAGLARRNNVVFNQHQAFMRLWNETEREMYGISGIERLERNSALGPMTTLTHMNFLTEDDVERVIASGVNVIWCPTMSLPRMFHAEARCWHPELYRRDVSISLATDTAVDYPLGSAGMTALLLSGMVNDRLARSDPFYMQTANAAVNMGMGDEIGTLAVGKKADIVIRQMTDIGHVPLDDDGSLISESSPQIPVDSVIINGKVVMEGGRLTQCDQDAILADALQHRDWLLKQTIG